MAEKSTENLHQVLRSVKLDELDAFLKNNESEFVPEFRPFAEFFRNTVKQHNRKLHDVFLDADISEKFGYSILSEEKSTKQRDIIVKLCLAGHFTLKEAQHALQLYGMSVLYPRDQRDAVLIVAFNNEIFDIYEVDDLLKQYKLEELYTSKSTN